ncbi:MAG: hypothetical protein EOP84_34770 [Verrucomicrobiaceae bacterium]|nr:MAG: hypothetical protein EOP84_34770 [Verrucomicrobiaceae bacterium]
MKTLLILLSIFSFLAVSGSAQEAFRLRFTAYDLNRDEPLKNSFQINCLDLREPSSFLTIGEVLPKTKLKLIRFETKLSKDAQGAELDVSELTLRHMETGEESVLPLKKIVNVPNATKGR